MDCSPPGSSVHGILQIRILEWVAIPFSRGSSDPGIELGSPALQADSLPPEPPRKPRTLQDVHMICYEILGSSNNSEVHRERLIIYCLVKNKSRHKTGHTQPYKNTTGSVKKGDFFCFFKLKCCHFHH